MNPELRLKSYRKCHWIFFYFAIFFWVLIQSKAVAQKLSRAEIDSLIQKTQVLDGSNPDTFLVVAQTLEKYRDYLQANIFAKRFRGFYHDYKGETTKSLPYYLDFLKTARENNLIEEQALGIGDLVYVYSILNQKDQAKKLIFEGIELTKDKPNYVKREATFWNNLGVMFSRNNQLDSAAIAYEKSLMLKERFGTAIEINNLKINLVALANKTGEYAKAERYLKDIFDFCTKEKRKGDLIYYYLNYGTLEDKRKRPEKSLAYYKKAVELSTELGDKEHKATALRGISNALQSIGDFQSAFSYYKQADSVRNEILNESTTNKIAELRETFEAEKREQENAFLNTQLNLEQQKNVFLGMGIAALVLFLGFGVYAFQKNRTKNRRLEEQNRLIENQKDTLLKLNEEKNELMRVVSHDLRSPMNAIALWLQNLKLQKLDATSKEMVATIEKIVGGSQAMVNRFLDVEKMQKEPLKLESLDISELVEELILDFKPAAKGKEIKIISEKVERANLLSDQAKLRGCLENLLSNALKFSHPKSIVQIQGEKLENEYVLHVVDEGIGIAEEEQAKLFQSFGTTSNVPTGNEISSGLGLSSVKRSITELGGTIHFTSALGKGSTFSLHLPL